jgi:hypothetical protein
MLLEMQYLSKSAIIAGGGGRNEEQGEMKAKYRYLPVISMTLIGVAFSSVSQLTRSPDGAGKRTK